MGRNKSAARVMSLSAQFEKRPSHDLPSLSCCQWGVIVSSILDRVRRKIVGLTFKPVKTFFFVDIVRSRRLFRRFRVILSSQRLWPRS